MLPSSEVVFAYFKGPIPRNRERCTRKKKMRFRRKLPCHRYYKFVMRWDADTIFVRKQVAPSGIITCISRLPGCRTNTLFRSRDERTSDCHERSENGCLLGDAQSRWEPVRYAGSCIPPASERCLRWVDLQGRLVSFQRFRFHPDRPGGDQRAGRIRSCC